MESSGICIKLQEMIRISVIVVGLVLPTVLLLVTLIECLLSILNGGTHRDDSRPRARDEDEHIYLFATIRSLI